MSLEVVTILLVFVFGIFIGSFLNVCILRIPIKQTIVTDRSHCMKCGYQLKWYDLVPLASWIAFHTMGAVCDQGLFQWYSKNTYIQKTADHNTEYEYYN